MKTKLILAAIALAAANALQAQTSVSVGFTFGSRTAYAPPPVYFAQPARHPAVVVAAPVYTPPPVVYCAPVVVRQPSVVVVRHAPPPVVVVRHVPSYGPVVYAGPRPGWHHGWRGSVGFGYRWH